MSTEALVLNAPPVSASPVVEAPPSGLSAIKAHIAKVNAPATPAVPAKVDPVVPVKAIETPVPAKLPVSEAPKVEVDEIDSFTKDLTPKSKDRFNTLSEQKAQRLFDEKMKSVKVVTPEVEGKLTAAEKRALDAETQLKQLAVERSPQFKAQFVDRPNEIKATLTEIAETYEVTPANLLSLIEGGKGKRRELNTLLSEIGDIDRPTVAMLANELQKITADKELVLKDHDLALKTLEQTARDRSEKQTKDYIEGLQTARQKVLETQLIPEMEKNFASLFEGEEGQAAKEKMLPSIKAVNATNLEMMPNEDRAAMILCAHLTPSLMEDVTRKSARILELEKKLAEYDSAAPPVGGGGRPPETKEAPKGFFDKLRELTQNPA